jgi:hypothetical protein
MTVTVYVYDDTHTVIVNTSASQGSTTMYDKTIKLYQGIDNTVKFALKDNDRKAVDLTNLTVTFNVLDAVTSETIIARPLTVSNAVQGLAQINLPASDLDDVSGGLYNYSLYTTNTSSEQQVVYTDLNEAAKGTLEVVEGVSSSPRVTEEMSTFIYDTAQWYNSNAVSGATERNLTSTNHTIATYTSSFDGVYKVQGNMNTTASTNDADWFDITLDNGNASVTVTNTTAIESYNFTTQAKWIRVAYDPDPSNSGTFDKVLLRN